MTVKQRIGAALIPHLPVTRFLFNLLRVEFAAWATGLANRVLPGRRARLRRIRSARDSYVNVACGAQVLPGFVNLDLRAPDPESVAWDCRRGLPLADGAAAGIRVEHFVEHLEAIEELPAFLADCRRCLRPGGVLRIVVPDAGRFLEAYSRPDLSGFHALGVPDPFPADLPTRMDVINHMFHQRHEHRAGYDLETLSHRLRAAGFRQIAAAAFGQSLDARLAQDRPEHAPYSLYVDAVP